jgi:cell division protein ZapA (FtsZ GTPase activity inhibitor)
MAETERLITFHLFGQEFSFYTAASDEETDAILTLVRKQCKEHGTHGGSTVAQSKMTMMACLNLAAQYLALQRDYTQHREETGRRLARMNKLLSAFTPAPTNTNDE